MSGSGPDTLPDVQKYLPNVREWSEGPPGCPGVVLIPSRMFGRTSRMFGRTSRMFGRTSRISGSGREALPEVQKWSGGPPASLEVVGRPFRMFGSG